MAFSLKNLVTSVFKINDGREREETPPTVSKQNESGRRYEGSSNLIEIEMCRLPLQSSEHLSLAGLKRTPTWDELFLAVHHAVSTYNKPYFSFGHVMLRMPPEGDNNGRCALYAGVTWSFISTFFKVPCGVGVGGVVIQCTGGVGRTISLPHDPKKPNPFSGGYHAWVGLQHEGTEYFVDMAYRWFQKHYSVVGPKHYFVATPARLAEIGILYDSNLKLAEAFDMCNDITAFQELFVPVLSVLQESMND